MNTLDAIFARKIPEGRIATAGNLAFPFSPSDIKVGEIYVFSVYALLRTDDPLKLFTPVYEEVAP